MRIEKRLELAELGRKKWITLKQTYEISGRCPLVLLLESDKEMVFQALTFLQGKLKQGKREKVVLLSSLCHEGLESGEMTEIGQGVLMEEISQEEGESLLAFYDLYQFSDCFFILSLEKPFASRLPQLEKSQGVSRKDMIAHCIFHGL